MPAPQSAESGAAPPLVLVVDALESRHTLRRIVESIGVTVLEAATAREALAVAAVRKPDAIVLDLELPDMEAATICRELRAWSSAPVIALGTGDASRDTRRCAPSADGSLDAYLKKPVAPGELAARLHDVLGHRPVRATAPRAREQLATLEIGDLVIDFDRRVATRGGRALGVTRIEWEILRTLAVHAGRTLTHQEIFEAVWRQPFGNAVDYVRVHIFHLRRKIERIPSAPEILRTERRDGYRFDVPRAS